MNVHNYTTQSGMKITSLEISLGSLKTESSKFSMTECTGVFRRVNGEGLAYDQMFCMCDVWLYIYLVQY